MEIEQVLNHIENGPVSRLDTPIKDLDHHQSPEVFKGQNQDIWSWWLDPTLLHRVLGLGQAVEDSAGEDEILALLERPLDLDGSSVHPSAGQAELLRALELPHQLLDGGDHMAHCGRGVVDFEVKGDSQYCTEDHVSQGQRPRHSIQTAFA